MAASALEPLYGSVHLYIAFSCNVGFWQRPSMHSILARFRFMAASALESLCQGPLCINFSHSVALWQRPLFQSVFE